MTLRGDEPTQNGYTTDDWRVKPRWLVSASDCSRIRYRPRNCRPIPPIGTSGRGIKTSHSARRLGASPNSKPGHGAPPPGGHGDSELPSSHAVKPNHFAHRIQAWENQSVRDLRGIQ